MIPVWLAISALIAGIWSIGDGICSIIYYWEQSPKEHLVRVIRIFFGVLLLACLYLARGYIS